jgi:hypothetical protein
VERAVPCALLEFGRLRRHLFNIALREVDPPLNLLLRVTVAD